MQVIPVQIISAQYVSDTLTPYYASPTNKKTMLTKVTLTNGSAAAETVDVHVVSSGGSADATNLIISAKPINADEAWPAYQLEGLVLNPGDELHVKASTASSIVIAAAGAEIF